MRILLLALMLAGCGGDARPDPYAEVCDHYAKLARACVTDVPDGERAQFELMSRDFCRKGMSGKHDELFGERYRTMIECTRTAEGCEAYLACKLD